MIKPAKRDLVSQITTQLAQLQSQIVSSIPSLESDVESRRNLLLKTLRKKSNLSNLRLSLLSQISRLKARKSKANKPTRRFMDEDHAEGEFFGILREYMALEESTVSGLSNVILGMDFKDFQRIKERFESIDIETKFKNIHAQLELICPLEIDSEIGESQNGQILINDKTGSSKEKVLRNFELNRILDNSKEQQNEGIFEGRNLDIIFPSSGLYIIFVPIFFKF